MYTKQSLIVSLLLVLGFAVTSVAHPPAIGWWKFDGDALDSSGYGHHGTLMGDPAPVFAPGVFDQALDTTEGGGPGYVEITGYKGILGGNPFSITAWINTSDAEGTLMGWGSTAGGTTRFEFRPWEDRLRVESSGNVQGDTTLPNNEWIHVAVTVAENAIINEPDVTLYLNGEVDNRTSTGGSSPLEMAPGDDVTIARRHTSGRWFDALIDDLRLYDSELTQEEIQEAMDGVPPTLRGQALDPSPADKDSDVPYYANDLSWAPGEFAARHTVYYSTSFDDVNDGAAAALIGEGLTDTTVEVPPTELGTTYYWRVDEVNGAPDFDVYPGQVWNFTTEAVADPITHIIVTADSQFSADTGPENTVNGSGLVNGLHGTESADMWQSAALPATIQFEFDRIHMLHEMTVWNQNQSMESVLGFGAKDITLEISANGTDFTVVEGVDTLNQAAGASDYAANNTIAFNNALAKVVRLTITSAYGNLLPQTGLSEVQFTAIPAFPREFAPADGFDTGEPGVSLSWRAGRFAKEHQVLVGDKASVQDGTAVVATTSEKSLHLDLDFGKLRYWQVIDVAEDGTTYPSEIMSFFTPGRHAIDDMERYEENVAPLDIWETWLDGTEFGTDDPDNGSVVGADPDQSDFGPETGQTHEGNQSLPLWYDNTTASRSEAIRIFTPALDLTEGSPDNLGLYFKGQPARFLEHADGSITMGGIGANIDNQTQEFNFAYKQLSGDGSITVRVDSIQDTQAWAMAGVVIRNSIDPDDLFIHAIVAPTFRTEVKYREIYGTDTARGDNPEGSLLFPYWLRITRVGNTFTAQHSLDGLDWRSITADPTASTVDLEMTDPVVIGLAVTSHQANIPTVAEFSNISTTGNVTGAWQLEAMTVEQPDNGAASVYVEVADTAGNRVKIPHPDPAASRINEWTLLNIPLDDLSGLNLSSIQSIAFGVEGPGVTGTVFADLLHVSKAYQAATPTAVSAEGLIMHYAFDGDASDSTGNTTGTLFGNATFVEDGAIGQALHLDIIPDVNGFSEEGYLAIDDFHYEGTGFPEVTVAAWVRTSSEKDQVLVSFDRNEYWRLQIGDEAGRGLAGFSVMTDDGQVDYGTRRVVDGQWHHLAGVFNNGAVRLYIDGVPQPGTQGGSTFGTGTRRFGYVGTGSESTEFNLLNRTPASHVIGDIDDVRIYHRALSPEEIATLASGL